MKYTKKQIAANRKKWIAALRSGKYRKGKGYLKQKDTHRNKYCCLGVACELAFKDDRIAPPIIENDSFDSSIKVYKFEKESAYLPYKVQERLGVTKNTIRINYDETTVNVAALNDEYDLSFKQIADLLEKTFKDELK